VEGIDGVEVKGYAVMSGPQGSESVALPYPEPDGETVRGVSFHHGRFVMQLRRAAARAPK
jgi:squalene monooxygenase